MATRKQVLWFGVSTAIIILMIYFADIQTFASTVRQANPVLLGLAFIPGLSTFFIWSNTWHQFLTKMGAELKYMKTLRMFMAGNFMNSITPLGQFGGEPLMAYVIEKNTDLSYEEAFSSVLSSDIINAVPIFTYIIGGSTYLLFFGSLNDIVLQILYLTLAILVIGSAIAYTLWFNAGFIENKILSGLRKINSIFKLGKKRIKKVEESLNEVEESFAAIGEEPRHLLETAIVAHLAFGLQAICLYTVMHAMGVNTDIAPLYFVIPMAGLATFSPTPGGSGAYEAGMATILTVFMGVPFATALAIGILFRLTTYWPGILIGYASLLSLEGRK